MRTMKDYQRAFGAHVKRLRKQRGYSQDRFAEVAELSQAYLSSVERGIANPRLDTVKKIATGLGLTMSDLFIFELGEQTSADRKARFISMFAKMPAAVIDEIYSLLAEAMFKK